jgi:hypothetical protein
VPRSTNIAYKIKITIPERIGKIYTMADRETDQRNRRKCYDGISACSRHSMLKSTLFAFQVTGFLIIY